jgi:hypothetical protein
MVTNKMKIMAIFFIVLMFGSTFAYGIMNLLNEKENQIQIPQDKILNYELSEQQKTYLMQKGYTLIKYDYSSGCLECIDVKSSLERITQNSDGQIYLQEITLQGTNKISIVSLNGQKNINKPTVNQTEEAVCSLLLQRPIFCLTSQI